MTVQADPTGTESVAVLDPTALLQATDVLAAALSTALWWTEDHEPKRLRTEQLAACREALIEWGGSAERRALRAAAERVRA